MKKTWPKDRPMRRTAAISPCGKYRWTLQREWDADLPRLVFIMLNPSTADASKDDPTIRKCIGFASRLGFGSITVVNLFSFRATKPQDLYAALSFSGMYAFGEHTMQEVLRQTHPGAGYAGIRVVVAWGRPAKYHVAERALRMVRNLVDRTHPKRELRALYLNTDGSPAHPLMMAYHPEGATFEDLPLYTSELALKACQRWPSSISRHEGHYA